MTYVPVLRALWEPLSWTGIILDLLRVLALAVIVYGFHPLERWRYRKFKGPTPLWLFGNLLEMIKTGQQAMQLKMAEKYGTVYRLYMGARANIYVLDPEMSRKVLRRCPYRYDFPRLEIGEEAEFDKPGILSVRGDYWRAMRGGWQPMFHTDSLQGFAPLMNASVGRMIERLSAVAKSASEVEIYKLFQDMTMETVGTTAFGVNFLTQVDDTANTSAKTNGNISSPDSPISTLSMSQISTPAKNATSGSTDHAPHPQNGIFNSNPKLNSFHMESDEGRQLTEAARTIFSTNLFRSISYIPLMIIVPELAPLVRILANTFPPEAYTNILKARKVVRGVVLRLMEASGVGKEKVVSEVVKEPNATQAKSGIKRGGVAPGSFLDVLMKSINRVDGKPFTHKEITSQATTFVFAGYETTATALATTLYSLAANPDKQDKIIAEIDNGPAGRGREPVYDDLDQYPYIEACVKEAIRLYPPALFVIREAPDDFEMGEYHIRKGTRINVAAYAMQRSPLFWKDPEAYIPERFMEGAPESEGVNPHAFVGFGDGARECVGKRFAIEEAKIALIRLYQKFTFRLSPGQGPLELNVGFTAAPKDGVHVTVHPRD